MRTIIRIIPTLAAIGVAGAVALIAVKIIGEQNRLLTAALVARTPKDYQVLAKPPAVPAPSGVVAEAERIANESITAAQRQVEQLRTEGFQDPHVPYGL